MGGEPFHIRAWHAARRIIVLASVIALVVAPLIVSLTHGPVAVEAAGFAAADTADEIAAHGHAHDDMPDDGKPIPIGGHDATDHEHQLQALISQLASAQHVISNGERRLIADTMQQLNPDGPKRPPRTV